MEVPVDAFQGEIPTPEKNAGADFLTKEDILMILSCW